MSLTHGARPLIAKSCIDCGGLKEASAFKTSGGSHPRPDPRCRDCHNRRARARYIHRKPSYGTHGRRLVAQSCSACGLILSPDRFRRPGQTWVCRSCDAKHTNERYADAKKSRTSRLHKRWNAATIDGAHRRGRQWTGPEYEFLAARSDLTDREVAALIGRTWKAVRHKRAELRTPRSVYMAGIASCHSSETTQHQPGGWLIQ